MALTFHSRSVHQNSCVRGQTYDIEQDSKLRQKAFFASIKMYFITCKSHHNVVIQGTNFSYGSRFLKFGDRLSLYSKNDNVFTPNSNLKHKISLCLNLNQNRKESTRAYLYENSAKIKTVKIFLRTAVEPFLTASCAYST